MIASMRIAYLVNQYPKVSHTFIRREILALEEAGARVCRFSIREPQGDFGDPADRAERQRTQSLLQAGSVALLVALVTQCLKHPGNAWRGLRLAWRVGRRSDRGLARHAIYFIEACLLRRWLEREDCEHVHAHFGTNPAAVALLTRELGGPPFSFTVHGPEEFDKATVLGLPEKIDRGRFVVAISSFGKSQLQRWCSCQQWEKIRVVHCGLDAAYLNEPPAALADNRRFVCVGRLCEQKGQLLLVDALARLVAGGVAAELVLVGDGEMRGAIEQRLEETGVTQHCTITGWASGKEVREYLRDCRSMILPSFGEGLPVVIMEAMAMGRPVISTYVAGIPELVKPGENGWLVPAGDVDALAEAMREALETPVDRLAEMGRAGRDAVRERHDIREETAKLAELFEMSIEVSDPPDTTARDKVKH